MKGHKFLPAIILVLQGAGFLSAAPAADSSHVHWVAESLKKMQSIQVGMTRAELMKVFVVEGGLSTPLEETFASTLRPEAFGAPDLYLCTWISSPKAELTSYFGFACE